MRKFYYHTQIKKEMLDDYGHVNNARYLELYEQARWNVFEQTSDGKMILEQNDIGIVILEVFIKFKNEITLKDDLIIESESENRGDRIFIINQKINNSNGQIHSTATFKAALFNLKTRKIVKADSIWLKALGVDENK